MRWITEKRARSDFEGSQFWKLAFLKFTLSQTSSWLKYIKIHVNICSIIHLGVLFHFKVLQNTCYIIRLFFINNSKQKFTIRKTLLKEHIYFLNIKYSWKGQFDKYYGSTLYIPFILCHLHTTYCFDIWYPNKN